VLQNILSPLLTPLYKDKAILVLSNIRGLSQEYCTLIVGTGRTTQVGSGFTHNYQTSAKKAGDEQ
jgi:hypothetical protein